MGNRLLRFISFSLTLWFLWPFLTAAYYYVTLDQRVTIVATQEAKIAAYEELLAIDEFKDKPSILLFHNAWTKNFIQELSHEQVFATCANKGLNLVYLSNEFGDPEYNRSRANWFNNICKQNLFGFHIYDPDRFELYETYILKDKKSWKFPLALLTDDRGNVIDTIYNNNRTTLTALLE